MKQESFSFTGGTARKAFLTIVILCVQPALVAVPTIRVFYDSDCMGIPLEGINLRSLDLLQWSNGNDGLEMLIGVSGETAQSGKLSKTNRTAVPPEPFPGASTFAHPYDFDRIVTDWTCSAIVIDQTSLNRQLAWDPPWTEMATFRGYGTLRAVRQY